MSVCTTEKESVSVYVTHRKHQYTCVTQNTNVFVDEGAPGLMPPAPSLWNTEKSSLLLRCPVGLWSKAGWRVPTGLLTYQPFRTNEVGPGSKHPGYPELWVSLIKHLGTWPLSAREGGPCPLDPSTASLGSCQPSGQPTTSGHLRDKL